MSTGQWLGSPQGVRWFLDAGAECLDFAYTGPVEVGDEAREALASPEDLRDWIGSRFARFIPSDANDRDLADAYSLRAAIARLAIAIADGRPGEPDDIDVVNLFAATPDVPPALEGGRRQAGAGRIRIGQALSTLAREAVAVFGPEERSRIRRCDADDCRMVFRDESRTLNRRWCSMQRCGNRAKVRAHRARTAAAVS